MALKGKNAANSVKSSAISICSGVLLVQLLGKLFTLCCQKIALCYEIEKLEVQLYSK